MSFFDEEDESGRSPRPRRGRPAGGVSTADPQTLLLRRAIAGGVAVVFLVLLAVVINSCRTSARESALKDYTREVSTIGTESQDQVGRPFFELLSEGGGEAQDLQSQISSLRVTAEQQRKQAEGLDVPGEMAGAQQNLLIALEQRRDALDYVAQNIRSALGDSGEVADRAIAGIAGQMEVLLASDVVYTTRVVPFMRAALEEEGLSDQDVRGSRVLPNLSWLSPQTIADQLDQQLTSGGRQTGEPTGPGLHGSGLESVAYGDTRLQPGGVVNRVSYTPGQPFVVTFSNQGENDEFEIRVTVRIRAGADQISLATTVPKVAQGETAEARLPLDKTPPLNAAAEIQVQVAPVPGEEKTDNNRATYSALFTRG